MSQDDFAIVIGISRYPSLGEPPNEALDLRGPENDTDAVVEWLKNSSGGSMPDANIKTIKSAQLASSAATAGAGPTRDQIEDHFLWLPPRTKKQRVRSGHDGGPAPLCLHVWPRLLPAAQSRMPFHGECDDGFWRECLSFGLVRLVSGLGIFFGVCPLAGLLHESRRHDPSFRGPTCPKNIP